MYDLYVEITWMQKIRSKKDKPQAACGYYTNMFHVPSDQMVDKCNSCIVALLLSLFSKESS